MVSKFIDEVAACNGLMTNCVFPFAGLGLSPNCLAVKLLTCMISIPNQFSLSRIGL